MAPVGGCFGGFGGVGVGGGLGGWGGWGCLGAWDGWDGARAMRLFVRDVSGATGCVEAEATQSVAQLKARRRGPQMACLERDFVFWDIQVFPSGFEKIR